MNKISTFQFFTQLGETDRKELAAKPITFLMSVDNQEGHKLEVALQAAHDDLIVKCARLDPANCELSAKMLENNAAIVDLLEQAITLQNNNLEVLALFAGQDQGPAGKPRVNVDEGWRERDVEEFIPQDMQSAGRLLRPDQGPKGATEGNARVFRQECGVVHVQAGDGEWTPNPEELNDKFESTGFDPATETVKDAQVHGTGGSDTSSSSD